MEDRTPCPRCGSPNEQIAHFCWHCGADMALEPSTTDLLIQIGELRNRIAVLERTESVATDPKPVAPEIPVVPQVTYTQVQPGFPVEPVTINPGAAPSPVPPMRWPSEDASGPITRSTLVDSVRPPVPDRTSPLEAGNVLGIVGALSVIAGIVFFLSIAFSRGWISPGARVAMGYIVSAILMGIGTRILGGKARQNGLAILAVSTAGFALSTFAATNLYHFIRPELGLITLLGVAAVTTLIAIRNDSELVTVYGLVLVLGAPPVLHAPVNGVTIACLIAVLAGLSAIVTRRDWPLLVPIAMVLVAPQMLIWLGDESRLPWAFLGIFLIWALFAYGSVGTWWTTGESDSEALQAILLLASSGIALVGIAILRVSDVLSAPYFAAALFGYALVHLIAASLIGRRYGWSARPATLMAGAGFGAIALAIPVRFHGPWLAAAWMAESAGLVLLYRRWKVNAVSLWALGTALLAIAAVPLSVYPFGDSINGPTFVAQGYRSEQGAGFGLFLLLTVIIVWQTPVRALRRATVPITTLLVLYSMAFEFGSEQRVLAIAGFVILLAVLERLPLLRWNHESDSPEIAAYDPAGLLSLLAVAAFPAAMGLSLLAAVSQVLAILPRDEAATFRQLHDAFLNRPTLITIVLGGACLVSGRIVRTGATAWLLLGTGVALITYVVPFQVGLEATVLIWLGIGPIVLLYPQETPKDRELIGIVSGCVVGLATFATLVYLAPPARLIVDRTTELDRTPFLTAATVCSVACGITILIIGRWMQLNWSYLVGAIAIVWGLSIGIVDVFQNRIDPIASIETTKKQAQVALSMFWSAVGVAAALFGMFRRRWLARAFGLGLIALATAKVFLFDLASLDASYRVLSFVGLGCLLLGAAYLFQRYGREENGADRMT